MSTSPTPHSPSSLRTLIDESCDLPPALLEQLAVRLEALFTVTLQRPEAEVCVLFVDDDEIRTLNGRWRGVHEPTDVLSFPMQEGFGASVASELLGDVVVSIETARRILTHADHAQRVAESLSVPRASLAWGLLDELTFLIIHGVLHLLGHDHAVAEEEREMRAEEARLMRPFIIDASST